ncbi:MAG: Uma2 family endonuclease [Anaerolineae bacterium]
MVLQTPIRQATFEEFKRYIAEPEHSDGLYELIRGEIVEKMPGRTSNSQVSVRLASKVLVHCEAKSLPCFISGEAGAYRIGNDVVAPDMAYKDTPMSDDYPDPIAPLWVVEIISPTDRASEIRKKREIYREAGILLWEVYPELQSVDVYAPGQASVSFHMGQELTGGEVLPGFTVAVSHIFAN